MNEEHERFGASCGGSRWFNAEPKIEERRMVPLEQRWLCPIEGCGGQMKFNGMTWPTGNPGYHHTCDKCQFTAAIRGRKYPRVTYVPDETPNAPDKLPATRSVDGRP